MGSEYNGGNLIGMYTNPMIPLSLLFVFKSGSTYYYLLKSSTEVHQDVIRFFKG